MEAHLNALTLSCFFLEPEYAHHVAHRAQLHVWGKIVAVTQEVKFLPEFNSLITVK